MKTLSGSPLANAGMSVEKGLLVADETLAGPAEADGILAPEEVASRIGGISVKSLTELIRKNGLEITTLGYAEPSRRGGPPRRIWGMTEEQLRALVDFRQSRGRDRVPG